MSLYGECELCDKTAMLHYKPGLDTSDRPSVCMDCKIELEEQMR